VTDMAARLSPSSSIDDATSTSGSSTIGYMEHTVSKLDTLAGVAIKYGVEVADIKRLNALTTDFQMYALKTLRIPLQGKHSPSAAAHKNSSGLTRT
jgi:LysM repeat protein